MTRITGHPPTRAKRPGPRPGCIRRASRRKPVETAARPGTQAIQPMSKATRILTGAALGVLSAGMLILAFPPYNVWPLIFLAFMPMLLADYRVLPPRWSGLASGLGWGVWLLVYLTMIFGLSADTWFMQG